MRHNPYTPTQRPRLPLGLLLGALIVALLLAAGVVAIFWREWLLFSASYPLAADVLRFIVFAAPVSLACGYAYAGLLIWWRRNGWRESIFADKQADLIRATKQVAPLATSFTYHDAHEISAPPILELSAPEMSELAIPTFSVYP